MDRRQFLRNAAILMAGAVAADQLDLVDKLRGRAMVGWTRALEPKAGQQLWTGDLVYLDGEYAYAVPAGMEFGDLGAISRANFRQIMGALFQEDSLMLPPLENPSLLEGPLPAQSQGDPTPKLLVVSR